VKTVQARRTATAGLAGALTHSRAHALDQNASIRQARPGSAHWIACLSSAPWFLSVTLVLTAVV
jgi:Tfp pilus assembly protein FimT